MDKAQDWHNRSQEETRKLVWSHPSVKHSFYKNGLGEVHILSPWRIVDYWQWTREPNPDDFVVQ
jgi:4-hydroxyacetophenone monooxygenase